MLRAPSVTTFLSMALRIAVLSALPVVGCSSPSDSEPMGDSVSAVQSLALPQPDGKIADEDGKIADEDGKIADEDGKIADEDGKIADEDGKIADEDGPVRASPR